MKNIFKVFTLVLLALFMVVGLTACDSSKKAQELLNSFLIEQDGKTLTSDFVLPAYLKIEEKGEEVVYDLVWSSNNSAIQLEQRKDEEGKVTDYLAKVTYPEEEAVVTLTVTLGKVSKDFTVRVSPVDVYNFSGTYVFPNDKQKVYKDFDLDQECAFAGKKATITWSVDEQYQAYIKISADGKKCLVTQNSLDPEVKIKATFTYKGESTTKQYKMTVSQEPTHEEAVSNWYNNPGSPNNFSGWIVEIATVYSESYGNVSFYVLDENEDAGYYGYRVKVGAADASKIKVGAYVTVTGSTNTMYNGLMETNAGALAEFDESKNLTAEQMAAKVKALDEDILAGSPTAFFNQSRLVSLNSWKITKVGGEKDSFLFEITKEGVTVQIRTSKYFEGAYNVAKDEEMAPFKALQTTLAVGDYVNVTGVLGRYESEHPEDLQKGINISPLKATDVVKAEAEAEGTAHPGKAVKALISAMNELMPTSGLIPSNRELTYATSNEAGATVELEVLHGNTNVVANNAEGKLTITPSIEEKVSVLAKFASGEYKTQIVYILHLKAMTPEELIDATFAELKLADLNTFGELPYPTKNGTYGTNISYTLVSAETDNVKVKDGKINVSPLAQEELTLKVTVSLGEDHKEKEIQVNLLKLETSSVAEFLKMKTGDMAILEGVVTAVNKDSGKTAFVLTDSTGSVFSYSGATVALGDKVKLVAALSFNADTPQMDKIQVLEQTEGAQADLAKALAAAGNPVELEVSSIKEKLTGENKLATDVAIVNEYSGKFLKIHGYIVMKGTYAQLMDKADYTEDQLKGDEGKGFANVYAAASISASSYAGKEVYLYGFFRGDSKGNYITIQVTKIEFVNAADGADCLQADKATVMAGESTEIKVTKAPWAQDVTLAAESADATKATVAVTAEGKVMVTGVSAAEEVEITITPSTGNAIKVKVEVKAADAQPITLAEFLAAAEGTEGLLIEGVVTSIKVSSKGPKSFHLTDAAGTTVFCYDGLEGIFLGQTLRLTAKRGQNYAMPQISTPTLVSKSEATADNLEAALAALGNPATATLTDIANAFLAADANEASLVAEYAGKLLKLEGYLVNESKGTKLYTEKGVTSFNAGLYGDQTFADYEKKNVIVYGIIRGTNLSGKYIQVAVITIVESETQPEEPTQQPVTEPMSYADFIAAEDGADVMVKGTLVRIATSKDLFLADEAGNGYYLYNVENTGYALGDVLVVTGKKSIYANLHEVKEWTAEKKGTAEVPAVKDITADVTANGFSVTTANQNQFVKISGKATGTKELTVGDKKISLFMKGTAEELHLNDEVTIIGQVCVNYSTQQIVIWAKEDVTVTKVGEEAASLTGTVVEMKYSGSTTNMAAGNNAATVGLSADLFTVTADKGAASNMPGLNKAGDIRLYWHTDGSNTITVTIAEGYVINQIRMTFNTGKDNVTVKVGDALVTATDGIYTINASTFVLGNGNTANNQVQIQKVEISYSTVQQ